MMRRGFAVLLIVCGLAGVAGAATRERDPMSLTGWFEIIWADPKPGREAPEESFFITTDGGETVPVLVEEAVARRAGGVLALNHQRVTVSGAWLGEASWSPMTKRAWRATGIQRARAFTPNPANTQALSGPQPWVSVLCRFSDILTEQQPLSYFQNMYASTYPGMDHYWREQSFDTVNVVGSLAVGWFALPHPRSYYIFDTNSDGIDDANLDQLAIDCIAAGNPTVNYANYVGINMMFNADLDCCAWGGGRYMTLDGAERVWRTTWDPPWAFSNTAVIGHEMGHGFGLPHSSGMYGATYDNHWDVMSDTWSNCGSSTHVSYGCLGQHTISYHKNQLEWIPPANKYLHSGGGAATITLEQLALPATGNYRMAQIPIGGSSTHYYTVEVRRRVGYDIKLPGEGVIIHEVDQSRGRPANVVDSDNNGNTGDAGAIWSPGETFVDSAHGISVQVNSTTSTGAVVTINTGIVTSVNLVSSANPSVFGTSVTFTATVIGGTPGSATGNVTFKDGDTVLGTVALASATAQLTTSSLTIGLHSITAAYAGSVTHPAATSGVVSQKIVPAITINNVTTTEGNAGTSNAVFNVTLSTTSNETVTVNYTTANGTATGGALFTNSTPIAVNSTGPFSPYPSNITVSGVAGTASKVTVTLTGVSHTWPGDIDVLLVGPGGQAMVLLSDAGLDNDVSNVTLTFDDAAATSLSTVPLWPGTYKPTNLADGDGDDVYPAPAPASGYGSTLSIFNGLSPNGTWSLYVRDDVTGDGGSLTGGWTLSITAGGSDYVASSGTLVFPPATTGNTLTVPINGDVTVEANETYFVNLSGAVNALITDSQGLGTINNDDGIAPPTNVVATATSATNVNIGWTAVAGATSYRVYRSGNGSSYSLVGETGGILHSDPTVVANTAYLYKVRAFNGTESLDSNRDLATTIMFTDPVLTAGTSQAKLVHFTQLLTAVNAVRALAGLGTVAFTAPAPTTAVTIRRQHLLDLRNGLDTARSTLTLSAVSYTDPTVTAGTTNDKAAHVTQLRNGTL
jgi:M6 family metalloprotease-like protein